MKNISVSYYNFTVDLSKIQLCCKNATKRINKIRKVAKMHRKSISLKKNETNDIANEKICVRNTAQVLIFVKYIRIRYCNIVQS